MSNTSGSEVGNPDVGRKKPKPLTRRKKKNAVDRAIITFEKSLDTKTVTLGEYLRLVQLQKETNEDEPKDIEVTWVDQGETKSSEK